jgi:hypothetical protein
MGISKKIFQEILSKYNEIDINFIIPFKKETNQLFQFRPEKLTIDTSNGYPKYYYNDKGIYAIQLRPIKYHEKKLIIGCGNNPTPIYYHYPYDKKLKYLLKQNNICCDNIKSHLHKNCVTIDPNIAMNPTIVTMFGKTKLPFLEDDFFESIEMEGVNCSFFNYYDIEYSRLIQKK